MGLADERRELPARPALTAGQQIAGQGVYLSGGRLCSSLHCAQITTQRIRNTAPNRSPPTGTDLLPMSTTWPTWSASAA